MGQKNNKPRTILKEINVKRQKFLLLRKINSKMVRGEKEKKGLILIELLMAMAIFAIGIVTISALFISATQGIIIGLEKTRGFLVSNEALEAVYAISKEDPDCLTPGKYEVGINNNNQWVIIPKTGLMGHFLLANNAQDSSGYKNHGIIQQVTFSEDRKSQLLAAARFNGIDSHIKTEYASSLQIEGPLTLSAWVMDTSVEKIPRDIAGKYDFSTGEGGYMLYKEGSNYYFLISGQGYSPFLPAPSDNLPWEHVAGVYDPGDQTMRLYINGQLKNSLRVENVTSINKAPKIEFFIGNDARSSRPWQGSISDVRVYKRALTVNEIAGLYGRYSVPYEKSLVVPNLEKLAGIWSFNEGEGCVAHDNSGNNNHGLIKKCSQTQWVENRKGKPSRAYYFENDNYNYIEIADSSTLQIKDKISIAFWIKMPEILRDQDMTILQKRAAGSDDYSFSLIYHGAEKGYGWAASVGASEQLNEVKLANTAIPNKWQHIVAIFDGITLEMYIDDNKINDLTSSIISNPGNNSNLFIGQNAVGQSRLSDIAIDDLRIYNRVITPTEIQTIFLDKINYYLE